jgi:CIC family chloride channel protein
VLELTGNPNIIMPGMLAVIAATLTSRVLYRQPSVYAVLLRAGGYAGGEPPAAQTLGGMKD